MIKEKTSTTKLLFSFVNKSVQDVEEFAEYLRSIPTDTSASMDTK